MKTALLLRTIHKREDGGIWVGNQWQGDNWLPIVISERELLHCIVIPEEWRLKFVYTGHIPYMNDKFYYGVRTDEYPLMWVWYWWKIRFDKSLEFLIMGLVLSLEIWGLAEVMPGAIPSLGDLKFVKWLKYLVKWLKHRHLLNQPSNLLAEGFFQNGWYFRFAKINKTGDWIAWSSKTPLIAKAPALEPSGTKVWFEFGRTKEEAIAKLKAEVYAL